MYQKENLWMVSLVMSSFLNPLSVKQWQQLLKGSVIVNKFQTWAERKYDPHQKYCTANTTYKKFTIEKVISILEMVNNHQEDFYYFILIKFNIQFHHIYYQEQLKHPIISKVQQLVAGKANTKTFEILHQNKRNIGNRNRDLFIASRQPKLNLNQIKNPMSIPN